MKISYVTVCIMVVTVLLAETELSMGGVTCNALQLSACASAITSSNPPTDVCCSKLKEQRPCLCQYLKDPNLKRLVSSPNARKVADACGSPFPTCYTWLVLCIWSSLCSPLPTQLYVRLIYWSILYMCFFYVMYSVLFCGFSASSGTVPLLIHQFSVVGLQHCVALVLLVVGVGSSDLVSPIYASVNECSCFTI